jgi:hypothetical protein
MWWCMFNRNIMVGAEGADAIKQGHGTIRLVHLRWYVGNVGTDLNPGGAFVDAPF